MCPILIINILLIILLIDQFIIYSTNNLVRYHYKLSTKPKIVIIGSLHGNESAGSYAINQLYNELQLNQIQLKQGELLMFPFVNKYGKYLDYRYVPSLTNKVDLNRIWYNNKKSNYSLIEELKSIISDADLVIDCHEGWGYHISNSRSMGSCLFCTHKKQIPLCNMITNKLNNNITDPQKKFLSRGTTNDLIDKPSLRTYCVQNNIPNILIETTGQTGFIKPAQKLIIRQAQQYLILTECLKHYNMI